MRLIDADALAAHMFHGYGTEVTPVDIDAETYKLGWNDAIDAIMENASTIEPKQADDLISRADDLIRRADALALAYGTLDDGFMLDRLMLRLSSIPSAQPNIVRCKECKHRKKNSFCLEHNRYEKNDSGYCSYGEREDE